MPVPDFFDIGTVRAGFAGAITDPADYSPGGPAGLIGVGLADAKTGLGGELSVLVSGGELREFPYPFGSVEVRAAFAYDLANGQTLDVPLRLGVGLRSLSINDRKKINGYTVEENMGLKAITPDTALVAGTGVRLHLGGPVFLRVDVDVAANFGDLPVRHATHTFWELTPSIGIDLRKPAVLDADRDGIPDPSDACFLSAEDMDGFEDGDGCPEEDNDKDSVLDGVDECPLLLEDVDGFRDRDGCPDPNNDSDEYPDQLDRCPDRREVLNGWQDGDGCPDQVPAALFDIEMMAIEGPPDPSGMAAKIEAARPRIEAALRAEPTARIQLLFRDVQPEALTPLVVRLRAEGLLERVLLVRTNDEWPMARPKPPEWHRPGSLIIVSLIDPVDAQGKTVPLYENGPP